MCLRKASLYKYVVTMYHRIDVVLKDMQVMYARQCEGKCGGISYCTDTDLTLTGTLLDIHPSLFVFSMRALMSESMQITQYEEKVALQLKD
jgi:hypothetical protein